MYTRRDPDSLNPVAILRTPNLRNTASFIHFIPSIGGSNPERVDEHVSHEKKRPYFALCWLVNRNHYESWHMK